MGNHIKTRSLTCLKRRCREWVFYACPFRRLFLPLFLFFTFYQACLGFHCCCFCCFVCCCLCTFLFDYRLFICVPQSQAPKRALTKQAGLLNCFVAPARIHVMFKRIRAKSMLGCVVLCCVVSCVWSRVKSSVLAGLCAKSLNLTNNKNNYKR